MQNRPRPTPSTVPSREEEPPAARGLGLGLPLALGLGRGLLLLLLTARSLQAGQRVCPHLLRRGRCSGCLRSPLPSTGGAAAPIRALGMVDMAAAARGGTCGRHGRRHRVTHALQALVVLVVVEPRDVRGGPRRPRRVLLRLLPLLALLRLRLPLPQLGLLVDVPESPPVEVKRFSSLSGSVDSGLTGRSYLSGKIRSR